MGLENIKILKGVKIDITPDGGATTSRSYIAERVRAELVRQGQGWRTGDGRNHINIRHQHIRFTLEGELIDQISNTGDLVDPVGINQDLQDPSGYTVEVYPDKDQAKKFTVIAEDVSSDQLIAEFTNLARSNTETIRCITLDTVSRADVLWFKRY